MKKYLLLLLYCLLAQMATAQDVIVKINGDELKARIQEITTSDILYLSADTTDTLNYKLAKAEVFMIRFANGTKEVFTENLPPETTAKATIADPTYMYEKGRQDARSYYNGTGALLGSAATVFLAGPVGPIIIGAVKPKAHNNHALPYTSLQDPNYVRGYEKQAHNRKIGKAALGTGLGIGVGVLYVLLSVMGGGQ
ncbi:hypothetical protein [Pontibacter fetidus]|uniref:Uncharacterized protein n=1 Tax=Pontibacter fetidus TaxID=2700082 RepID=A0A6B2H904_9BACT|nr:hypothetical protein [Pontibacter fetidus]NDK57626.1 hypothetical protein [Pontibacter fetidus]